MGFFQDYLPTLRGLSLNTIHTYRDAIVLLQFVARDTHRRIESLESAISAPSRLSDS